MCVAPVGMGLTRCQLCFTKTYSGIPCAVRGHVRTRGFLRGAAVRRVALAAESAAIAVPAAAVARRSGADSTTGRTRRDRRRWPPSFRPRAAWLSRRFTAFCITSPSRMAYNSGDSTPPSGSTGPMRRLVLYAQSANSQTKRGSRTRRGRTRKVASIRDELAHLSKPQARLLATSARTPECSVHNSGSGFLNQKESGNLELGESRHGGPASGVS
jgi:hypothetical protein